MSKLPCEDCITYALCLSAYLKIYKKNKSDPRHIHISCLILARSELRKNCPLLENYLSSQINQSGYYSFYRSFVGLGKDALCKDYHAKTVYA